MYVKHRNGYEAREPTGLSREPQHFWGFTLSGSASLEALARFYGLRVPGLEPGITLSRYLERDGNGSLRPGYRAAVGGAELRVLAMNEGAVSKVGLELRPARLHRPQPARRSDGSGDSRASA